jgi:transposase
MASAPDTDSMLDAFLADRGHEVPETWDESYNKKQCPDCGGLHDSGAVECSVCGWRPA